jgi:hypothetical protein
MTWSDSALVRHIQRARRDSNSRPSDPQMAHLGLRSICLLKLRTTIRDESVWMFLGVSGPWLSAWLSTSAGLHPGLGEAHGRPAYSVTALRKRRRMPRACC